MRKFKFEALVKEFPFLIGGLEVVQNINWTHKSLGQIRVCRADRNLLGKTGRYRSYSNAAGYSSCHYTQYVAVWRDEVSWQYRLLDTANSFETGGGYDNQHTKADTSGEQLVECGLRPEFILEVNLDEDDNGTYRHVVIHKVRGNLLENWASEQAEAAEIEAACSNPDSLCERINAFWEAYGRETYGKCRDKFSSLPPEEQREALIMQKAFVQSTSDRVAQAKKELENASQKLDCIEDWMKAA